MENLKLPDGEMRLLNIIWENEPIKAAELAKLALEELGWKRTTTYTVIKRLSARGAIKNDNSIVSSCVERHEVQRHESRSVMEKSFGNSLPEFIAAFLGDKKISRKEAEELKRLIDNHKEE